LAQNLTVARHHLPQLLSQSAISALDDASMTLEQNGDLRIAYAPFDYIETKAHLVIVGITPGRTQALNALAAAEQALRQGKSIETALAEAKLTGSFSGALRSNLVAMLDDIGVADHFGLSTTADLFKAGSTGVHFTSALRYPVFVDGKNYNGSPDMLRTPVLRQMIETHLAEEARALPSALWLPLGPKAEAAVAHLTGMGLLAHDRVLSGLPHPSGANAERVAVFLGRKKAEAASRQTDPVRLLAARMRLHGQLAVLKGVAA
jgi:hypothetical protein